MTGGTANIDNVIIEFSGVGVTDGSGVSASGSSASPAPGNMTVLGGDLVLAMFGCTYSSFSATITQPSGWSEIDNVGGIPGLIADFIYKINPSSPSNPTWTNGIDGGASTNWGAAQFAFKAAAAAAAGNASMLMHF